MIIGIERRGYPSARCPSGTVNLTVVLVQGEVGDVCAYIGEGPPEWVVREGDKLPAEEVDAYFPGFVASMADRHLTYRR